ncbi:MAG: hypothetical protein HY925_14890, partial [Elusimicrobia bacterium]|nr:hypothetical protein [Elusimicrobiota bacterium]
AGVADGLFAARAAAEFSTGAPVVLPPGGAGAFLAKRPLACLRPEAASAERLSRWGLRSCGELARLSAGEVSVRLGPAGLALHRAARGLDEHAFVPEPHPAAFFEGAGFEWPVSELEPFARAARPVLDRLFARLSSRGLACRSITATLELDPSGRDERALPLGAPTREAKTWLGLLLLELGRRPPRGSIAGFWALAVPEEQRLVQLTLFGPPAASPDKMSTTLARLAAHLGPDKVGTPVPVESYRPEAFAVRPFEPPPPPEEVSVPSAPGHVALRVLRPRVALDVRADSGGRPAWVRGGDIEGSVRVASGPWKQEDGWWSERAFFREYWDVELSDGALYRIFHEPAGNRWFADGIYD